MLLATQHNLGMIPSWQYDTGWAQNPKYNQFVKFPPGMDQMTIQPIGPNYGPPAEAGLGRARWMQPACCENCVCAENCPGCPTYTQARARMRSLRGLGLGTYSQWALIGGIALVGLTIVGGALLARRSKRR